jgi:hypothetical protein
MGMPSSDFVRAGSLAELKAKGRLVVHGRHSPMITRLRMLAAKGGLVGPIRATSGCERRR